MPNATLDPQDERERLDELEQSYNAPAAPEKDPVSADDLEAQYNLPSAKGHVYDDPGAEDSSPLSAAPADKDGDEAPDAKGLNEAEAAAGSKTGDSSASESPGEHENQVGAGYIKNLGPQGFIRKNLGKHNRIFLVGGGGLGLAVIIVIFLFVALAPLKILNIVNNLQNRFYATSESAVSNETDVLFSDYLRKYVLPAARKCPGAVTKNCNPIEGGGLVSQLYKGWRNAKLEDKLATDYGIEFKVTKQGHYYVKMPGMTGDGANIDDFVKPGQQLTLDDELARSKDPQFKKVGRAELRQAYRDALAKETKWKQVLYRYKIGGLLSKKYGLKRCVIACDTRDNFADWKDNKTRAARLILVERVLVPRSESLGLIVGCIISGDCDKTQTNGDGKKTTAVQSRLQARLDELAAEETGKYVDVLAHSSGILKDGYQKYLIKLVAAKLLGKEVSSESADQMLKVVPVVGWVNAASTTVTTLEKAPQEIRMASYLTNATAMIGLYTTYRVYADEVKTGNADPQIAGSFNKTLGPGEKNDLGGVASAEGSPLYQKLIDGKNSPSSNAVKCNDGKTIPTGKLVCPEEVLGGSSSVLASIEAITNSSWFQPIKTLNYFWTHTAGKLLKYPVEALGKVIGDLSGLIPGVHQLEGYLGKAAQPLIDAFVNYLIPSPFGDIRGGTPVASSSPSPSTTLLNSVVDQAYAASSSTNSGYMSGARVFDLMAGGADASGNDYAHNGLGGQVLTPAQTAAIVNDQLNQGVQDYQKQPVLARLFDTSSPYSLASRIALAMPSSKGEMLQSVASLFSNPFSKLTHAFGLIFNPTHAFATAGPDADPFGITQYGYSAKDPTLAAANQDPPNYWDQQCSSDGTTIDWKKPVNAKWQDAAIKAADNSSDGMPENVSTDPCLLLQATVGSAGGLYDDSLLGDDQPGVSTPTTSSSSSTGGSTSPFPGGWTPNRLDMGYDGTFKGQIAAPFSGTITYAANSFSNWGGYLEIKADQQPNGLPTSTLYFAEGISPLVKSGQHVNAGDAIAAPAPSPYGNAYHTTPDGSGQIEWGVAADGPVGQPTNPLAETGISNPRQMVLDFSTWAVNTYGLGQPSQTSNAGAP